MYKSIAMRSIANCSAWTASSAVA